MTRLPPPEVLNSVAGRSQHVRALDDDAYVFLVDAPAGPWVLKRALFVDAQATEWEHSLLREVAGRGFPVHRPVPYLDGKSWKSVDGELWVALSYLPGRPLRASGVVGHQAVGDFIASFHDVSANLAVPDNPRFEPLATTIAGLSDDWSSWRFGNGAAARLRACREQTLAELELRGPAEPTLVVHGDLHVGNILVESNPDRITGVIDFNMAHRAEPVVDLAFNLWWWCRPAMQQRFWDAAAGTLTGYRARRALSQETSSWLVTLLKARGLMLLVRLRDHEPACAEIHETLRWVVDHDNEVASCASQALARADRDS